MAEQPAQQPQPQPPPPPRPETTPPQPPLGPAGPPGPEGRTQQGTTPQPGIGGAVEPGQPTEGAGLPTPDERTEQARTGRQGETPPQMNQNHDVHVGDKVQLNGTLFNVSSGQYDWTCKGPDGETVPLTNPTMPGPSFTATQTGAYVSKLTTDDGVATITVNAADPDVQPLAGTTATRVPLHSGGTLVGPSPEVERLRQEEALRVSGQIQPGQQGQTVEERQALEAQRQTPRRPGETEEQHQERVRQEAEQRRQQSQPRPGETPEQHQERLRKEEQERQEAAARSAQE